MVKWKGGKNLGPWWFCETSISGPVASCRWLLHQRKMNANLVYQSMQALSHFQHDYWREVSPNSKWMCEIENKFLELRKLRVREWGRGGESLLCNSTHALPRWLSGSAGSRSKRRLYIVIIRAAHNPSADIGNVSHMQLCLASGVSLRIRDMWACWYDIKHSFQLVMAETGC
jgi:hypothetical protein